MAILMVMVVHWDSLQKLLPDIAGSSWSGVDLFFVISGYVVTLSLLRLLPPLEDETSFAAAFGRTKEALKIFYARRFFRIVPAALSFLLLQRFCVAIFPESFGSRSQWLEEGVAFFGGVYNYALPYHLEYRMGILWSLAVEEHFYLILPILFVAMRTSSRRLAGCLVIALACIACRALPPPSGVDAVTFQKFSSHLRFDSLMAGVAMALLASRPDPVGAATPVMPRPVMRFLILPAAIAIVACLPGAVPEPLMLHEGFIALWFLSSVLVGFAGLDRGYVLSLPVVSRVLEHIGSRSYVLYLTHVMVGFFESAVGVHWPAYRRLVPPDLSHPLRRVVVLFLVSLLLAEILHRTVETPFMRIGRALTSGQRGVLRLSRGSRVAVAIVASALTLLLCHHILLRSFGPRNLALHATVTQSSHADGTPGPEALVNGKLESEVGLHTRREDRPWAVIDLGEPTDIGAVRVYNRDDGFQLEALPLELSVSSDGKQFVTIARREVSFTQAFPWRVHVGEGQRARYVRLQVDGKDSTLCLSEVEIYRQGWVAQVL